jgi:hydroxymethylglutaryl-CoA synthase
MTKVDPSLKIPQRIGNIYTGSLYSCLISLLVNIPDIKNKNVLLFSYGSGLCSSMLNVKIHKNPLNRLQVESILGKLENRIKISPNEYTQMMLERERNYGVFRGHV